MCAKGYYNSNLPGTKFCTPDWDLVEESDDELMSKEYDELKQEIESIKIALNNKMIYNYIDNNMPSWAHEGVKWCVDNGIIEGTGDGLGLDDKDLKYCVILYRALTK